MSVVAIVEQRNVPITIEVRQGEQELAQRARGLGELEPVHLLDTVAVANQGAIAVLVSVRDAILVGIQVTSGAPAGQMTNVCLGQLVVTKIKHFVSAVGQCGEHFHLVLLDCVPLEGLQRDNDIGVLGVGPAVTQLGHVARIDELVEFANGAGTLGDRDRHEGFGGVSTLRDKAKSVKNKKWC